jgi:hypothetical protein
VQVYSLPLLVLWVVMPASHQNMARSNDSSTIIQLLTAVILCQVACVRLWYPVLEMALVIPLSEMKAKQFFICRLLLMNTVAMTSSIGGSFQWTDSVRHSPTSDEGTLLKETWLRFRHLISHPLGQVRNVVLLCHGSLPAGKISSLKCTHTSLPIWGSITSSSCIHAQ